MPETSTATRKVSIMDDEPREINPGVFKVTLRSGLSVLATLKPVGPSGRLQITELKINGGVIRADDLRLIPMEAIEATANEKEEPLPDVNDMDRATLLAVWDVYAQRFAHPAAELARRSGLKPSRIHTWVREARMRGQLAPTSRCSSFGDPA